MKVICDVCGTEYIEDDMVESKLCDSCLNTISDNVLPDETYQLSTKEEN